MKHSRSALLCRVTSTFLLKYCTALLLVLLSVPAYSSLFGVSSDSPTSFRFVAIDSSSGQARTEFVVNSFSFDGGVFGLTYIPETNKFLTTGRSTFNDTTLIEIDPVAMTARAIVRSIPNTSYNEGIEYSQVLGGIVVSYGRDALTTSLALLNPANYTLIANQVVTPIVDADILFVDYLGQLNVQDSNQPSGGFSRNIINNPFGAISLSGVNSFPNPNDFAFSSVDGILYSTSGSSLSSVNNLTNAVTSIGSHGAGFNVTGLAAVPEPVTMTILAAGLAAVARRRQRKS